MTVPPNGCCYVCPDCGAWITNDCNPRIDDAGTPWYKCDECRKETATPKIKKLVFKEQETPFEKYCEEGVFKPAKMAKALKANYDIRTDIEADQLYFYYEGLYSRNGDMILRGLISELLDNESTPARVKNTIYELHNQTIGVIPASKLIALRNGYFDVKTKALIEPTPTEFVTIKCPVRYDPEAKCPAIEKFF